MRAHLIIFLIPLSSLCVLSCNPRTSSEQAVNSIAYDLSPILDTAKLQEVFIGNLSLPTGMIVASDPFLSWDVKPFRVKVTPGSYPVKLLIYTVEEDHYRVAFAKIVFADQPATHWKLAIADDPQEGDVLHMEEGEIFGYGVDAGLGCFTDEETNKLYNKAMDSLTTNNPNLNYYTDVLEKEFAKAETHPLSENGGSWDNHFPIKGDSTHNVIMFSSGWGDGFYATYWGLSQSGDIVELITDFNVLMEEDLEL
jgi:hypothetical protein